MAEPKTRPTDASVDEFIDKLDDETKRDDCRAIVAIMKSITKQEPVMWGPAIIGFGSFVYAYSTGKELTWPRAAFSPRKQNLTVYLMPELKEYKALLKKVGKAKKSGSCLYFKRLADVHVPTLKAMITLGYKEVVKKYEGKKKRS
jgi:hypothetical protein